MHMKRRRKYGYITPPRNALDDLASAVRKEKLNEIPSGFTSDDVIESEEDVEDLVFQRAVLPNRTGNFDIDFPDSPKQSKGRGKKSKSKLSVAKLTALSSENTGNAEDFGLNKQTNGSTSHVSDGKTTTQSGDFDMNGNIRPSGVISKSTAPVNNDSTEESDKDTMDSNVTLKNPSGTLKFHIELFTKFNTTKKNYLFNNTYNNHTAHVVCQLKLLRKKQKM